MTSTMCVFPVALEIGAMFTSGDYVEKSSLELREDAALLTSVPLLIFFS